MALARRPASLILDGIDPADLFGQPRSDHRLMNELDGRLPAPGAAMRCTTMARTSQRVQSVGNGPLVGFDVNQEFRESTVFSSAVMAWPRHGECADSPHLNGSLAVTGGLLREIQPVPACRWRPLRAAAGLLRTWHSHAVPLSHGGIRRSTVGEEHRSTASKCRIQPIAPCLIIFLLSEQTAHLAR